MGLLKDGCAQCRCAQHLHLVGLTIDFLQSFALHLEFHLRIFLKNVRISLTKHLCDPFVGYSSGGSTWSRRLNGDRRCESTLLWRETAFSSKPSVGFCGVPTD